MAKILTIKKTTPKVQEWRKTPKSQNCDTTKKSQEWIVITRAQGLNKNQEVREQLTKRITWHLLRRP